MEDSRLKVKKVSLAVAPGIREWKVGVNEKGVWGMALKRLKITQFTYMTV